MVYDQKQFRNFKYNKVECPEHVEGQYYFYILECKDNTLYCGSSSNIINRLKAHNSGKAALWTKIRRPLQLVYFEVFDNLLESRQREFQIKGWSKIKKEKLLNKHWKQQKLSYSGN